MCLQRSGACLPLWLVPRRPLSRLLICRVCAEELNHGYTLDNVRHEGCTQFSRSGFRNDSDKQLQSLLSACDDCGSLLALRRGIHATIPDSLDCVMKHQNLDEYKYLQQAGFTTSVMISCQISAFLPIADAASIAVAGCVLATCLGHYHIVRCRAPWMKHRQSATPESDKFTK